MSSMNQPTYIEEALRRIDSEIFAEPNQMKIILQKELQGLGERIIEEINKNKKNEEPEFFVHDHMEVDEHAGLINSIFNEGMDKTIDLIRSLTLPKS